MDYPRPFFFKIQPLQGTHFCSRLTGPSFGHCEVHDFLGAELSHLHISYGFVTLVQNSTPACTYAHTHADIHICTHTHIHTYRHAYAHIRVVPKVLALRYDVEGQLV